MKKLMLPLLAIVLFAFMNGMVSCSDDEDGPLVIQVMTHNVLAYAGHPTTIHKTDSIILNDAVTFYKEMNPDILVIQESPIEEDIELLADALGYNYVFFKRKWTGSTDYPYGFPGAILTKFPITSTFDVQDNRSGIAADLFERYFGIAEIETDKGSIQIAAMHLCADFDRFREDTRLEELEIVFDTVQKDDTFLATFIIGDCNSEPQSGAYKAIIEQGYVDTYAGLDYLTYKVPDLTKRIDYIFMYTNRDISHTPIPVETPFNESKELYLSDHRAVMTKFVIE